LGEFLQLGHKKIGKKKWNFFFKSVISTEKWHFFSMSPNLWKSQNWGKKQKQHNYNMVKSF
jgi:hypothetical protein